VQIFATVPENVARIVNVNKKGGWIKIVLKIYRHRRPLMSKFESIREKVGDDNQNVIDAITRIEYLEEAVENLENRKANVRKELNRTKHLLKDMLLQYDISYLIK
jgi:hypothetical protein